jgi:hypothetical protein
MLASNKISLRHRHLVVRTAVAGVLLLTEETLIQIPESEKERARRHRNLSFLQSAVCEPRGLA